MFPQIPWNTNIEEAPRDGTWLFIIDDGGNPACVYWLIDADGREFGWTYDGGDTYRPVKFVVVTDDNGRPIKENYLAR